MSVDWALGIIVPIFMGKGTSGTACVMEKIKFLEHRMIVLGSTAKGLC